MLFNRRLSNLFTITFITALSALTSQAVLAGWTLDSDASSLYYVTSKAASRPSETSPYQRKAGLGV